MSAFSLFLWCSMCYERSLGHDFTESLSCMHHVIEPVVTVGCCSSTLTDLLALQYRASHFDDFLRHAYLWIRIRLSICARDKRSKSGRGHFRFSFPLAAIC